MIIGVCGFGSTGSSAVSDFLSEYGDFVQVLDDIEFTWVSNVDSLIDLEYHLFNPHGRTGDSIVAIQRYSEFAKKETRLLCGLGIKEKDVLNSVKRFLDSITLVKWYWYDFRYKKRNPLIQRLLDKYMYEIVPRKEIKAGNRLKTRLMSEVSLSIKPHYFYENARNHVKDLLKLMGATLDRPLILDQPFSGNNPQACFPFYDDAYAIVVDRDPRDNYVFAKTKLLGRNHFMAIDSVEDFIKYYKALRDNQPYRESNKRVLRVQFEELVYNYDEATKRIVDFLHFPNNPNKKSIFNPDMSINNTQVWKRFPEFEKDIEKIEVELSEYLFDFEKYDVKPCTRGEMFFGKSPLRK